MNNGARWRLADTVALLAVVAAAVVIYLPSLRCALLSDDYYLAARSHLRGWHDVASAFLRPFPGPGFYRPVAVLAWALDLALWRGAAWGHHLSNLLLHAVACALVYLLARHWLGSFAGAAAAAALFAVHPIHHEAVTWLAGRFDLLCGVFYLAALAAFIHSERRAPGRLVRGVSLALFALALLSKEMAISFPLVLALYLILPPRGSAQRSWGSRLTALLPFLVVAGCYVVARRAVIGAWLGGYGPTVHFLVKGLGRDVTWQLAHSLIAPFGTQDLPPGLSALGGLARFRAGFVLASALVMLLFLRHTVRGLLWIGVTMLPILGLFGHCIFYLPSVGLCLSAGGALAGALAWARRRHRAARILPVALAAALGALAWTYGSALLRHERGWQAASRLSRATLRQAEQALDSLGVKRPVALLQVGFPDSINYHYYVWRNGLSYALAAAGYPVLAAKQPVAVVEAGAEPAPRTIRFEGDTVAITTRAAMLYSEDRQVGAKPWYTLRTARQGREVLITPHPGAAPAPMVLLTYDGRRVAARQTDGGQARRVPPPAHTGGR